MILVDTSVWVDHFRKGNTHLRGVLSDGLVVCHPFVVGELACGNLKKRKKILALLNELPRLTIASNDEVFELIERRKLSGRGIGWVDSHLLSSSLLSGVPIWTSDRRLAQTASDLGINFDKGR